MYKYLLDLWNGVDNNVPQAPPLENKDIKSNKNKNKILCVINSEKLIYTKNNLITTLPSNDTNKNFKVNLEEIKGIKLKNVNNKNSNIKKYSPRHPVLKEMLNKVKRRN